MTLPRPIYENSATLADEQAVIRLVSERWRCSFHKLGRDWRADYLLCKDGLGKAVVEVKCRTNERLRYPTYAISARKIESMLTQAQHLKLDPLLIVRWTDVIGWHRIEGGYDIKIGGRRDRGDGADIEPMCHIPVGDFRLIGA